MIRNQYKINSDVRDLDLQKDKMPYHQSQDVILKKY